MAHGNASIKVYTFNVLRRQLVVFAQTDQAQTVFVATGMPGSLIKSYDLRVSWLDTFSPRAIFSLPILE